MESGAEAIVKVGKTTIKDRIRKNYRIKELDEPLRKSRTKREAKVLDKLSNSGFTPKLIKKDKFVLEMETIKGKKVRDILKPELAKEIANKVAYMHNQNLIHGDLTTSNMIFNKSLFIIDFGLAKFSEKVEDKAVDIHLFRQALESKHHKIWKQTYKIFLEEYTKQASNSKLILNRLEKIELRGRNKGK